MFSDTNTRTNGAAHDAQTTARLAERAHETVDRLAASARGAEIGLRTQAADLSQQAREQEERIKSAVNAGSRRARAYLLRNPLLGVGAAFATGAVIAALLVRK